MPPLVLTLLLFSVVAGGIYAALDARLRQGQFQERLSQILRREPLPQETVADRAGLSGVGTRTRRRWTDPNTRRRRFEAQIPDALLLIVSALRTGHSPAWAVRMIAEEMAAPLAEEFQIAQDEISLGLPAAAALARMSERVRSADWDLVATAVTTQVQTGGNLAEILEQIAGTVRERVRVQGEITTLTAEGRLSALILILLPPVLALALILRDPHYFQPLLSAPLGHHLIAGAIAGQIIGTLLLRRMLKLDL